MHVKNARNWLFVTALLLSPVLLAAPCSAGSNVQAAAPSTGIAAEARVETITAQLQVQLNNAVRAELVQRIKADSRGELHRQLQSRELLIQPEPAMGADFELTISNPGRKIRLTYR